MLELFLRKWVIFSIIVIFTLFIGVKVSIVLIQLLFWFLISVLVINLAFLLVQYFGINLSLKRLLPGKIEAEGILEIQAFVKNNSFLPAFNLVIKDHLSCACPEEQKKLLLVEYLGAKSCVNLKYSCLCPLRGKYKIGPLAVYFFDPLGLFFLKKNYSLHSEIYVYPRTFAIKKFPNLVKGTLPWFGIETSRVSGDEDEFFGVREYKEGDPIKKIHWISTARKNSLIVKQFQRQSFFKATILFNLEQDKNFGVGNNSVAEYIIKIAASIAKCLIEKGIDISLQVIVHAQDIVHIPFNKGPGHLEDIVRFLATVQAESKVSLGEIFKVFSNDIPNDSTLVVIMLDKDWQYLAQILQLEKRNISILPLILISSTFLSKFDNKEVSRDIKIKLSQSYNFNPMVISCQDNLEEAFLKF